MSQSFDEYKIQIKHILGSVKSLVHMYTIFLILLPPVVCRRAHVLFTLFVFVCGQWCPTHCAKLFIVLLPVSLDWLFVIAPSIFSSVYLLLLNQYVKVLNVPKMFDQIFLNVGDRAVIRASLNLHITFIIRAIFNYFLILDLMIRFGFDFPPLYLKLNIGRHKY